MLGETCHAQEGYAYVKCRVELEHLWAKGAYHFLSKGLAFSSKLRVTYLGTYLGREQIKVNDEDLYDNICKELDR